MEVLKNRFMILQFSGRRHVVGKLQKCEEKRAFPKPRRSKAKDNDPVFQKRREVNTAMIADLQRSTEMLLISCERLFYGEFEHVAIMLQIQVLQGL